MIDKRAPRTGAQQEGGEYEYLDMAVLLWRSVVSRRVAAGYIGVLPGERPPERSVYPCGEHGRGVCYR